MPQEFSNEKSIFLQIAQMIENDIVRGVVNENEQCLSTNELARLYNINPNTAAKGLTALVTDGILYKKRGVGMFVSEGARDMILSKRRKSFDSEFVKPLLREATIIGVSKDEIIKTISEDEL